MGRPKDIEYGKRDKIELKSKLVKTTVVNPASYVTLSNLEGRYVRFEVDMTLEGARELWKALDALYAGREEPDGSV